jgi:hypothetical protein
MPSYPKPGTKLSFDSTLENWAEGMDYCAIPVPVVVTDALGTKSAVLVLVRVNGSEPFQASLFPAGGGRHYLRVRAKVRRDAKLTEGDRVKVRATVLDRADVTIADDLAAALREADVSQDFDRIPPGRRNYLVRRIDDAAKPDTRAKRVREAVEEAERAREKRVDAGGKPRENGRRAR